MSSPPPASQRPAVVLVQPRIPQNVGAVGRLCAAARASLHVVRPIPFALTDRAMRRAGMDYLELLDWHVHDNWAECTRALRGRRLWLLSSKAGRSLHGEVLRSEHVLVFGSEEAGLPREIREGHADGLRRIVMPEPRARCLNLATACSVALFELLRQAGELGG